LHENNIGYKIDIIYGLPGDNFFGSAQTFKFSILNNPAEIYCFLLKIYPGTKLWEQKVELGINCFEFEPFDMIGNKTFSPDELDRSKLFSESIMFEYYIQTT